EHRLMHAETLAYMFHWLPYEMKENRGQTGEIPFSSTKKGIHPSGPDFRSIPAGQAMLGQAVNGPASFGWDNEFQRHSVSVPEFSIDALNVTNEQFLRFVRAGGYAQRSLWNDEGWNWIQQEG